jgi:hypothetical protein
MVIPLEIAAEDAEAQRAQRKIFVLLKPKKTPS